MPRPMTRLREPIGRRLRGENTPDQPATSERANRGLRVRTLSPAARNVRAAIRPKAEKFPIRHRRASRPNGRIQDLPRDSPTRSRDRP
jgi:hypothetical protein